MHTAEDRKDGWSQDDDRLVVELRARGQSWKDIATQINRASSGAFNRTADACSQRYRRLLPKDQRPNVYNSGDRWSEEEEARLMEMVRQRMKPREIAEVLGKRTRTVQNKIQYVTNVRRVLYAEPTDRVWTPPHLLEDRDRRMKAERDITAEFFGDPRPGQSALDKKQGAFA